MKDLIIQVRNEILVEYGRPELTPDDDPVVQLGIGGIWAFGPDHPLTPCAIYHDAAYSIPVYQKYNPRSKPDKILYECLREYGASKFLAGSMYRIVRLVGGNWWECDATRRL